MQLARDGKRLIDIYYETTVGIYWAMLGLWEPLLLHLICGTYGSNEMTDLYKTSLLILTLKFCTKYDNQVDLFTFQTPFVSDKSPDDYQWLEGTSREDFVRVFPLRVLLFIFLIHMAVFYENNI